MAEAQVEALPMAEAQVEALPMARAQVMAEAQVEALPMAGAQVEALPMTGAQEEALRMAGAQVEALPIAGASPDSKSRVPERQAVNCQGHVPRRSLPSLRLGFVSATHHLVALGDASAVWQPHTRASIFLKASTGKMMMLRNLSWSQVTGHGSWVMGHRSQVTGRDPRDPLEQSLEAP